MCLVKLGVGSQNKTDRWKGEKIRESGGGESNHYVVYTCIKLSKSEFN